mmetsp:Transcript_12187/g.44468  ORF Transcript_12187/g.44468 Transcript_12187/m.44468 type:complete len:270 (+) Transcript_12187:3262-4071(+)
MQQLRELLHHLLLALLALHAVRLERGRLRIFHEALAHVGHRGMERLAAQSQRLLDQRLAVQAQHVEDEDTDVHLYVLGTNVHTAARAELLEGQQLAALLIHRHNLRVDDVARNAIGNCRLHLCDHVRKPRSVLVAVAREQPHAGGAVLALAAVDLRALAVILVLCCERMAVEALDHIVKTVRDFGQHGQHGKAGPQHTLTLHRRHTALNEGRHEHVQRRAQVVGLTDCVRCGCHLLLCCCAVAASVQYRSSCKGCQGALQRGADSQVSH